MSNEQKNMIDPSVAAELPEKLSEFQKRLQNWVWSLAGEGAGFLADLNTWRQEQQPAKGAIPVGDNKELAETLRDYLADYEKKKGWARWISYLFDPIAKAEETHGALLFLSSFDESLDRVINNPLSENVEASGAILSEQDKEILKRNISSINPLQILEAPGVPQSVLTALTQSRRLMRWYHLSCWFSSLRRMVKNIWDEVYPLQQQVNRARRHSAPPPQSSSGQQNVLPQEHVEKLRLTVNGARNSLNQVPQQFKNEGLAVFGHQIEEESQLNDIWMSAVIGNDATGKDWAWFGYRNTAEKGRREYLLYRRLLQQLNRFESALSQPSVREETLRPIVESLVGLLWDAFYLRGRGRVSEGASAEFWKAIILTVRRLQGALRTSKPLSNTRGMLWPVLNALMTKKRPAWQVTHEQTMKKVYQPLLAGYEGRFNEWQIHPNLHPSRTKEESRSKLEGTLALLKHVFTESMRVTNPEEAAGYRWTLRRYAREMDALLRGDVLPKREAMPSASEPTAEEPSPSTMPGASQSTSSIENSFDFENIFIFPQDGTPEQQRAFTILGLSLDKEISVAEFRQHWRAMMKEKRDAWSNVGATRELLDEYKAVVHAGQLIGAEITQWKEDFEKEQAQIQEELKSMEGRIAKMGSTLEECHHIAVKINASAVRTEEYAAATSDALRETRENTQSILASSRITHTSLKETRKILAEASEIADAFDQTGDELTTVMDEIRVLLRAQGYSSSLPPSSSSVDALATITASSNESNKLQQKIASQLGHDIWHSSSPSTPKSPTKKPTQRFSI